MDPALKSFVFDRLVEDGKTPDEIVQTIAPLPVEEQDKFYTSLGEKYGYGKPTLGSIAKKVGGAALDLGKEVGQKAWGMTSGAIESAFNYGQEPRVPDVPKIPLPSGKSFTPEIALPPSAQSTRRGSMKDMKVTPGIPEGVYRPEETGQGPMMNLLEQYVMTDPSKVPTSLEADPALAIAQSAPVELGKFALLGGVGKSMVAKAFPKLWPAIQTGLGFGGVSFLDKVKERAGEPVPEGVDPAEHRDAILRDAFTDFLATAATVGFTEGGVRLAGEAAKAARWKKAVNELGSDYSRKVIDNVVQNLDPGTQAQVSKVLETEYARQHPENVPRETLGLPGEVVPEGYTPPEPSISPEARVRPSMTPEEQARAEQSDVAARESFRRMANLPSKVEPIALEAPESSPLPEAEKPASSSTLYSNPVGLVGEAAKAPFKALSYLVKDLPIVGDLLSGKAKVSVRIPGYAEKAPGRVRTVLNNLFGTGPEGSGAYANLPQEYATKRAMAEDVFRGRMDLRGEFASIAAKLTEPQALLLREITDGSKTGMEPEFRSRVASTGLSDHAIQAARAFRTEANAMQQELFDRGAFGEDVLREHMGKYVKAMYDTYVNEARRFGRTQLVKRIIPRQALSEEWKAAHLLKKAGLPEVTGLGQDAMRLRAMTMVDDVKSNPAWTLPDETVAKMGDVSGKAELKVGENDYVQFNMEPVENLPPNSIERFVAETYGLRGLQGKWVLKPIAADLESMVKLPDRMSQMMRSYLTVRGAWKVGKSSLNIRNSVGNVLWNQAAVDMAMRKVGLWSSDGMKLSYEALKDLWDKSPEFRQAQKWNTFGRGLNQEALDQLRSEFVDIPKDNVDEVLRRIQSLSQSASRHYGLAEQWAKMTLFKYGKMFEGMSDFEASRFARKHIFDYGEVPKAVRFLRTVPGGPAFITFQTKVIPRVFEYAMDLSNPYRFWKYPFAMMTLTKVSQKMFGVSDEELKTSIKQLGSYATKFPVLIGRLGDGKLLFADPKYLMPYMDWLGGVDRPFPKKASDAPGYAADTVWSLLKAGGPEAGLAGVFVFNRDPYTGRDIVGPSDTTGIAKMKKQLLAIFRVLAPEVAVQAEKTGEAVMGLKTPRGLPRQRLAETLPGWVGLKTMVPDRRRQMMSIKGAVGEEKKTMSLIRKDQSLSIPEKRERIRALQEQTKERLGTLR